MFNLDENPDSAYKMREISNAHRENVERKKEEILNKIKNSAAEGHYRTSVTDIPSIIFQDVLRHFQFLGYNTTYIWEDQENQHATFSWK